MDIIVKIFILLSHIMTKKIKNIEWSVAEATDKTLDPKAGIRLEASENIATSFKEGETDSEESKEKIKERLLNKPNMTSRDKKNMASAIDTLEFLWDDMNTKENFEKLDAVNYGSNYIEIGGVKFSKGNWRNTSYSLRNIKRFVDGYIEDSKDPYKPRVYCRTFTWEMYFNFQAAQNEVPFLKKFGMNLPSKDDISNAMEAISWVEKYRGCMLWVLLWLKESDHTGFFGPDIPVVTPYDPSILTSSMSDESPLSSWCYEQSWNGWSLHLKNNSYCRPLRPILR